MFQERAGHTASAALQERRLRRGLSRQESYKGLQAFSGKELLKHPVITDLLEYSSNWEPFIVNRNPLVKPTDSLQINRFTGEVALPYPFVVPSRKEGIEGQWGNQQFYWDQYFVNKALLRSGKPEYIQLAINHVENFQYLFDRLGYIPNASQVSILTRPQIPFLTGMIRDIYEVTGDTRWLKEKMDFAKREYEEVCMYTKSQRIAHNIKRPSHRIDDSLSLIRPVGTDVVKDHYAAAAMTGEDDSSQWAGRAYEVLPIGLNAALFKYESDFSYFAKTLGLGTEETMWENLAEKRKREINQYFWDKKKGTYFDAFYDRKNQTWKRDSNYYGLTSFMPLWVGLATQEQADRVMKQLPKFESPYGLMIASKNSRPHEFLTKLRTRLAFGLGRTRRYMPTIDDLFELKQWDYSNIWAPMEYFAINGMMRYGKNEEAKRVMENILRSLGAFYQEHGTLPEKMDGVTGANGKSYQYPTQEGYGWTCALVDILPPRIAKIA